MKLLLTLAALVALVAGGSVPLIPGDNSHYVEGESSFVRAAGRDGNPPMVNLNDPLDQKTLDRSGIDNQYWLYTRANPDSPQFLILGNAMSIWGSNYLGSRPLKVIIHGFASNGESETNKLLTSVWLASANANIIVVDWRGLASSDYTTAFNLAPDVGQAVGTFLTWLINSAGGNWNNVHITGIGMGGQIAGIAGRQTGGRPRRLTGLDPVDAMWFGNPNAIGSQGINEAQYVEIIHTTFDRADSHRIGHVDFYPNAGDNQPGCSTFLCSHNRAYELFAATIQFNHLIGLECADANEVQNNQCSGSMLLHMGNDILTKTAVGIYALTTGSSWPF